MKYYFLENFAQYGQDAYGTSEYGDSSGGTETPPLADTGYVVAPGVVLGALMIIASLVLLFYKRPRKYKQVQGRN